MKITATTDGKYLGRDVPDNVKRGDLITFDDFEFAVEFVHTMSDGAVCLGNENYQLILEVL